MTRCDDDGPIWRGLVDDHARHRLPSDHPDYLGAVVPRDVSEPSTDEVLRGGVGDGDGYGDVPRGLVARGAAPVLLGIDVHTKYQAGLNIEQVAREGFAWVTVKVSQGLGSSWAAEADGWLRRAEAAGMVAFAYHYLTTDDVNAQARTAKAAARGRPVMLDAEDGSGNVANVRAFLAACARVGVRVPLVYLPRWWWQKVGSASLAGLPPLVSSRYRTATGTAASIYSGVPGSWWDGYGGGQVAVLQFSDRATVAGKQLDVNAFRGTREQLRALIHGGTPSPAAAPTPRALGTDLVMDPIAFPPGAPGRRVFLDPPGARVIEAAWFSWVVDGPDGATATATLYPQHAGGGTGREEVATSRVRTDGSHTVDRYVFTVPPGTDQITVWGPSVSPGAVAYLVPAFRAAK